MKLYCHLAFNHTYGKNQAVHLSYIIIDTDALNAGRQLCDVNRVADLRPRCPSGVPVPVPPRSQDGCDREVLSACMLQFKKKKGKTL